MRLGRRQRSRMCGSLVVRLEILVFMNQSNGRLKLTVVGEQELCRTVLAPSDVLSGVHALMCSPPSIFRLPMYALPIVK